ncbi:maleate cis-trans isomerase family protein [Streptomyces sp. NBC_01320]|uniref:maleate cis-trans isomerase family protein n=1 Tax=Streptomyces sp. NBC_01320 TaxID=2903824 RepID=UPI002E13E858
MSERPKTIRIGQIVPSSNVTMETEIPALFRARETVAPERFTFHSSRMRMKQVRKEELAAMDADSTRCAAELSDARVDVLGYACLVAIMSMGHGYHRTSERNLTAVTRENGAPVPVVTSAGALVGALHTMGARSITLVAPYLRPLTETVVDYIRNEGIEVGDWTALEIPDNLQVAAHDPRDLVPIVRPARAGCCPAPTPTPPFQLSDSPPHAACTTRALAAPTVRHRAVAHPHGGGSSLNPRSGHRQSEGGAAHAALAVRAPRHVLP